MDGKIFHKLTYGLFIIGSIKDGAYNGQIANTAFQISSDPATVAIGINKNNLTHEFIEESGVFSVAILPKSVPLNLIGHFGFSSGRKKDKYADLAFEPGKTGAPILKEDILGYLEAEVVDQVDVFTHTLFIGKVVAAKVLTEEDPMTYAYYHQVKRGQRPAEDAAPAKTKANKAENKEENGMQKFECDVCGYVYDPAEGDPDNGVAPGTAFADIPEDWVCPVCGVGKDEFSPVE